MALEPAHVTTRRMREPDLAEASKIVRLAFGTFIGVPEPASLWPDRDSVGTRWRANPEAAFVAEVDGTLAGSNVASHWGSFAFFGPLTVRPAMWNRGISQLLLAATPDLFAHWGVRDSGLFTFANSPKHVHLYEKFGYSARFLTASLSKPIAEPGANLRATYSVMTSGERASTLDACRALTDSLHDGLDVTQEIRAVYEQRLGDTVVIWDRDSLDGFAVCHCGEGTEAGTATCYVKFAAVRGGVHADAVFERLLDACERLASGRALTRIEAGVNLGRRQAYHALLRRGFRVQMLGVAMHRPDTPLYNRPEVYVIDDWR